MTDGMPKQPRKWNKNASVFSKPQYSWGLSTLVVPPVLTPDLIIMIIFFLKAWKQHSLLSCLRFCFPYPYLFLGFFLSPIVLGQKSSPALSFVDERQVFVGYLCWHEKVETNTRGFGTERGKTKAPLTPSLQLHNFLFCRVSECESVRWSISLFLPFDVNI